MWARLLPLVLLFVALSGCGRFSPKPQKEYVYVVAKETFLRDRIAAVSNRVGNVTNGQKLEVIEHSRRFLKVKTDKNEVGWIEEHGVIDQNTWQQFADLQKQHANDPVISTATLHDDLYLHVKPGRQSDRFFLLPEGDKLQMIVRASVPKDVPPQAAPAAPKPVAKSKTKLKPGEKPPPPVPEGPPMEDWWLVRDTQGRVGWMLSRRLDIDIPDAIAGYAESQRMVGAYQLAVLDDPESKFPDQKAREYVAVLSPYKDGLPYDFDQVRVFIWNLRKHRYETAFRQRDLQGYLPVHVGTQTFDKIGTVPVFSFKTATGDTIAIDPATGSAHAANLDTLTYRLEGSLVHKVEPPAPPPPPPPPAPAVQAPPVAPAPAPTPVPPARVRKSRRAERRHVVHARPHKKHH